MKIKSILVTILALSSSLHADAPQGGTPAAAAPAEKEESPFEEAMSTMGASMKALRSLAKDDFNKGAELANKALVACCQASSLIPEKMAKLPDGPDKAKTLADFRRLMGVQTARLAELELAYLSQDAEKVAAATKSVFEVKKEGHEKYEDE